MATDFLLPDIGEGLTEAEIIRWLVSEGDTVELDQPIVEIETDKALMEIPTPLAGVVVAHGAPEGAVVEVGEVLVSIRTPSDEQDAAASPEETSALTKTFEAAPIVGTLSSEAVDLAPRPQSASGGPDTASVQALPIVRKLASDLGVDLTTVTGTGTDGTITRDDVRAAAEHGEQPSAVTPEPVPTAEAEAVSVDDTSDRDAVPGPPEESEESSEVEGAPTSEPPGGSTVAGGRIGMSKLRRTIAERMTASWKEIPHVTTFGSADVTRLMASRTALKRRRDAPVSIDAMVIKAVVVALGRHEKMTARLEGDELVYPESVDVGVAVDTDDGLMVVVVQDPAGMDLVGLTEEVSRLSQGARNRTLLADAFGGQSFTVSNIGAVGGGYGTPLVPHGTTGILSVGRAVDTPVARNGRLEIAPMMPLSLSYDHRVIDGAEGRRFLATVIENLEEPTLFLA